MTHGTDWPIMALRSGAPKRELARTVRFVRSPVRAPGRSEGGPSDRPQSGPNAPARMGGEYGACPGRRTIDGMNSGV